MSILYMRNANTTWAWQRPFLLASQTGYLVRIHSTFVWVYRYTSASEVSSGHRTGGGGGIATTSPPSGSGWAVSVWAACFALFPNLDLTCEDGKAHSRPENWAADKCNNRLQSRNGENKEEIVLCWWVADSINFGIPIPGQELAARQ